MNDGRWPNWMKSGLTLLFSWLAIFIFLFIISLNGLRYQLKYGLILLLVWLVVFVLLFIRGRDWPNWLKTGSVILSIWLVIFILFFYYALTCNGMLCGIVMIFPLFPSAYLVSLVADQFGIYAKYYLSNIIISAFLNGFLFFIIGILIGWVFKKNKI
ncbi:hypothetical protein J4408_01210 [Candidatus Pacearchaeota archaeon]|nr:hypothetical protein [Candidatus Pacearchaeota archaeon]